MGHIELASPVAHILFLKSLPSRIGLLLDMTLKDLERVLYFENFVVTDSLLSPLKEKQLLSEDAFYNAQDEYGEHAFVALIGAGAAKDTLAKLDLDQAKIYCRKALDVTGSMGQEGCRARGVQYGLRSVVVVE